MSNKHFRTPMSFIPLAVLLTLSILVSGCSIKSGPKDFDNTNTIANNVVENAPVRLAKAFSTTASEGKKFYFSGWAGTKIQKRMNGYYFTGTYDRDKGYSLDARIFGQPFRYYRWGNDVYLSEQEKWRKIDSSQVPLTPFVDFDKLLPYASKAVKGKDENILGKNCDQYIIPLNSEEAFKVADSMGIKINTDRTSPEYEYINETSMKIHIDVGKDDNFIYKYLVETTMPVPGAGSIYQEVSFKIWKYNNPGINLPGPKKLEPYLVKKEDKTS